MAVASERLAAALNEAYAAGYVGSGICGSDFGVDIVLHSGAGAYIVGEETALIESLEGNRGMPRLKPPYFPAAMGLYNKPTIVNNVETLSNLPWIITHGAAAFVGLGSETSAGTRVFAVSGHVRNPGVFEVPFGITTFGEIICDDRYGGGLREGRTLKRSYPVGPRLRGSPPSTWICRWRRRPWTLPGRCSARAPSWSWTPPPTSRGPATTWCGSSPGVLRQVHTVPGGHQLLEVILERILLGSGQAR